MAMTKSVLGLSIKNKIDSLSPEEKLSDISVWTAVGEAIIDHIKNNAEISPLQNSGITVSPPSAVITQGATIPTQGAIS